MPQNKKFLAQKQKEDRQKRIIIIATITIIVAVIGLIVYGVIDRYVLRARIPVVELENQTITANDFDQQVRWRRRSLIIEIDQILNTFMQLGGTPEVYSYFEQQLNMTMIQLEQPLLIGQEVLQTLREDIIFLVEAEKMGIVVDNAAIDKEIQLAFGYYADGTPTPLPTNTPAEDLIEEEQPAETPQEETGDQDPDPTATPLLVPTEYTEELFDENFQVFLTSIKDDGITENTIRVIVKNSIVRQRVYDQVTADVDQTQEQVRIRHILVEDEDTILEVAEKLAGGEDFADLAAEYSIDESNKDNGGDLGWFGRGRMVITFEEAAFELEVGDISEPVQTDFGWHILESLGKEDRLLDLPSYEQIKTEFFSEWINEKLTEYDPVINEEWEKFVPTEPSLPLEYLSFIQSIQAGEFQLPTLAPEE
jgi:parvulin-like peptidyl-prolyl isomerase